MQKSTPPLMVLRSALGVAAALVAVLILFLTIPVSAMQGSISQNSNQATPTQSAPPQSATGAAINQPELLDYVLSRNDRLRITVFGEADLSGEFVIDAGGTVSLPLIGNVQAAGMNLRTFQTELERLFREGGYLVSPRVSAQVLNFRPVYVIGEVRTPGEQQFTPGLTLLNAIAQAGGYTALSNVERVLVRREGVAEEIELPVRSGIPIMPGDTIRIEKTAMFIFGEVRNQGEMPIPPGLTVRTAVAQAGGFTDLADTETVFLKRAGSEEEIPIPFSSGELVRNGDILRVDKSSFFIMGEVARTGEFPMRPGLTVTNAAILAGGFTTRADTRRVYIRRAGETQERRYRLTNDLVVQKGDTIRIPERFF